MLLILLLLLAGANAMAAGPAAVWGFADLHVHPAAHLAFGSDAHGEDGLMWGKTGLAWTDAKSTLATDMPPCYPDGHEGFDLDIIRKATHKEMLKSVDSLTGWQHAAGGYPNFRDWPNAQSIDHQQIHILALHRAYEGGLRLMVATAVDNQFLTTLWTKIGFNLFGNTMPQPNPTFDYDSARKQLDFLESLAAHNSNWMQVVTSAAEARQAIRANKLALVLGLEFDSLTADQIVDLVKNHHVRQVIPIHLANNSLGGTAISENLVNGANYYLNGSFFKVSCDPVLSAQLSRPSMMKPSGTILMPGAMLITPVADSVYHQLGYENCKGGHKNTMGLGPDFANKLFPELLRAGVLLDVAHMSELSREAVISMAEAHHFPLMASHDDLRFPCPNDPAAECGGSERDLHRDDARRIAALGGVMGVGTSSGPGTRWLYSTAQGQSVQFTRDMHEWSQSVAYQGTRGDQTIARLWIKLGTGSESLSGKNHIDLTVKLKDSKELQFPNLNRGQGWDTGSGHSVELPLTTAVKLQDITGLTIQSHGNWTMSGANLAANERELDPVGQWLKLYQNALAVMGGRGVALGTDQNGFSPQIPFSATPVSYPLTVAAHAGPAWDYPRPPMPKFQMGNRVYDFQKDGLAHYGMLADFMQALSERTDMHPQQALDAIYHSAEDVVEMWEKAEAAGRASLLNHDR